MSTAPAQVEKVSRARQGTRGGLSRRRAERVCIHAALILGSLIMAYPFVYGLLAGFATIREYEQAVFLPLPHHLSLDNVFGVFGAADFGLMFRNTLLRTTWYALAGSLIALLCGYAFARLRFPGRNVAFVLLLSSLMVPGPVVVVPLFIMVAHAPLIGGNNLLGQGGHGMVNTWWALLSLSLVNPYAIFFMRQAIQSVPLDYEEAARIDGASVLRIIFQVYVPLLSPVIATVAILSTIIGTSAISVWNDYFIPLIFTDGGQLNTIALGTTNFAGAILTNGQPNYPLLFMGSTIAMLPTILVFLIFQRYLVQGFAATGIKG